MRTRRSAALIVAVALTLGATVGRAQSADELNRARQSWDEGNAAFGLGNFEEAAQKFEAAYKVYKTAPILYALAQAHRRIWETSKNLDALARAIELYKAYLRMAAPTAANRPMAQQKIPELEKALAEETRRRRADLIAKATGREGLFLAEQLIADGAYKDAALVLDRVLGSRGNPRDVVVGALEKRALVGGQLKQHDIAVEAYKRLLVLDSGFILSEEASAESKAAFAQAKAAIAGQRPLTASHVPPGQLQKNENQRLTVRVESDPLSMVTHFGVRYRTQGGGAFSTSTSPARDGGAAIPKQFVSALRGGTKVEYYLAALDESDNELVTMGSAKEPFIVAVALAPGELAIDAPPKKPIYKKGWFWGTIAGVAVAAGAGIGLGVYFGGINNPAQLKIGLNSNTGN